MGQINVTTNAGGNVAFSFTAATPLAGGQVVTATATNTITSETSEFSEAVEIEDNTPPPEPQCSDGADNDMDGQTDSPSDPGCESADDDSEGPDPPAPPACTITGTEGADVLAGTSEDDVIRGLGGIDVIYDFEGGTDTLIGGIT